MSGINEPAEIKEEEPKPLINKRSAERRQKKAIKKLWGREERFGKRDFKNQKHVDLLSFNAGAEDMFVQLVRRLIERNNGKPVTIGRVLQKTSFKLNISPMTAKRYLQKHTDDEAELRVFGEMVMLNPNFVPEPEEE